MSSDVPQVSQNRSGGNGAYLSPDAAGGREVWRLEKRKAPVLIEECILEHTGNLCFSYVTSRGMAENHSLDEVIQTTVTLQHIRQKNSYAIKVHRQWQALTQQ